MVRKDDIINGLRKLGLKTGDTLVVHSSLSSFGRVSGGAETVVDAVIEVIGCTGTLVVPTYTYGLDVYDPAMSKSLNGAITEAVRKRPNAIRSKHPSHSVASIGRLAEIITEDVEKHTPFGRGSALFNVLQAKGKILLLGTTHTANSMVHVAEEIQKVAYLDRSRNVKIKTANGSVISKWIRRPGCSRGFDVIEESLEVRKAIKETLIGNCAAILTDARSVVDAAIEILKADPEGLLCDDPECESCAEARAMLAATDADVQDKEIVELAEEEEKTRKFVERQLEGKPVKYFDSDEEYYSSN